MQELICDICAATELVSETKGTGWTCGNGAEYCPACSDKI